MSASASATSRRRRRIFMRPASCRRPRSSLEVTSVMQPSNEALERRSDGAAPAFGHFKDVRQEFKLPAQTDFVAIENISFDLTPGALVSLLGPSGCGKTTFLKLVGGLIRAGSGVIQISGEAVSEPHDAF